jgi:peptide-methionine (S)-S-oxide reductase
MWFTRPTPTMIEPHEALPGRDQPMPVREAHRVLATPLTPPFPDGHQVLYVAMGCFWGAERLYWQLPGVYTTAVGYMGGWTPTRPTRRPAPVRPVTRRRCWSPTTPGRSTWTRC